jgi:response regulator NasT
MSEKHTCPRNDHDIQSAKKVLITQRNMTESEAHRYLQKMSMDAGRSLTETARMVLLFAVR